MSKPHDSAPDAQVPSLRSLQDQFASNTRYPASADEKLAFYRQMLLIRRFEEKAGQLYGLGLIGGFCHLYIGQEAVAIGLQSALNPEVDSVITGYRDHGHMLAYGIDPKIIMAELTGRHSGISRGKGGSMHMFSTAHKFYGGHGIVGAQVALGGGLALAHQYNEDGGLCLAYFGDGAANQGQVYETFNMAALWKLPIVFVVENNRYAMGTAVERSSAETEFHRRGAAFRIPGMHVDGMDVLQVRQAAEVAFAYVRDGNGPVLMECSTYRYRGHSMSDPAKYRTREEVQEFKEQRDPIEAIKRLLVEDGTAEDDLRAIDKEIRAIVAAAADFAETSPEPEPEELYTDVLVDSYSGSAPAIPAAEHAR
ncbi:pyruvate dehydrogenase (acetyl-transferring) E1 component subunit alpha [Erythrobacteraceae bacterium CFH 75059]|uniref:pyruvate dehydrogenase (acetyl-transferring) E1 component subunit alpha n=1 Tax=Qipengyuania thermophila TaxID=2509361 RepID=UPI001020B24F|nr:pyruvate dehydrogenase (acetyl-transferring) E1 component subunit alpha [Qipengyuania thermophila]TCD05224.1 pyruvate dehydrogenase (acetyl-transferring) E1 component subunit alpha [Erythrobacteraceae bacterium CFH 75059]